MDISEVVVIGMAAWRITSLISYEPGPAKVFTKFRELLDFEHDEEGHPTAWPDKNLQNGLACPWCLGMWVASLLWAAWVFGGDSGRALVAVLAIATVVIAAQMGIMRLKDG